MLEKLKKYRHFSLLAYYWVIYILYLYTEKVTRPRYIMYSRLDDYIPFVKEMVIPYLFWYVYIFIALVYLGIHAKEDFYKLCAFMFIGMTICFIIYLKLPNGHHLRPLITGSDFFSKLIQGLYASDTPTNSAPSMHTLNSVAVHISILRCKSLKNRSWLTMGSLLVMVSIIASTVMIKQHSILDVLYGIALSMILYLLIYQRDIIQGIDLEHMLFSNHTNK